MTKFTKEKIINAIQRLESGEGPKMVSLDTGISESVLTRASRLVREHGIGILYGKNQKYTVDVKLVILKYMKATHSSVEETAIKFGIKNADNLRRWERQYLEHGMSGLEPKKKGRPPKNKKPKPPLTREEELLERIEYLEAENAFLKKLNALVAEQETQEKQKKSSW